MSSAGRSLTNDYGHTPGSNNLRGKFAERKSRSCFDTTKGPNVCVCECILLEEFENWPFRPHVRLPSFNINIARILIIVLKTSGLNHSSRVVFAFGTTIGTLLRNIIINLVISLKLGPVKTTARSHRPDSTLQGVEKRSEKY